jgi:hypothetical protein
VDEIKGFFMQEWHLTAESPLSMRFAADARLKRTDYADDQSWEIAFGEADAPFLTFQTRYGGRVNIARLVPMFALEGRTIYIERRAELSVLCCAPSRRATPK